MLQHAEDWVVHYQLGSTSMLQSKLKIGYSQAKRILNELEQRGVVGPLKEKGKPRDVLMTAEELRARRRQP